MWLVHVDIDIIISLLCQSLHIYNNSAPIPLYFQYKLHSICNIICIQ